MKKENKPSSLYDSFKIISEGLSVIRKRLTTITTKYCHRNGMTYVEQLCDIFPFMIHSPGIISGMMKQHMI